MSIEKLVKKHNLTQWEANKLRVWLNSVFKKYLDMIYDDWKQFAEREGITW